MVTQLANNTPTKTASPIQVLGGGREFILSGVGADYRFHVDDDDELVHDHFGPAASGLATWESSGGNGWGRKLLDERREFPDLGRGDFRVPAVHIRHSTGSTVSAFKFVGYDVVAGKPPLPGLPATFGDASEVATLVIHLEDKHSSVVADLRYSIFPAHNAIARSFTLTNNGSGTIEVQRAASFSADLPSGEWEMIQLSGEWCREAREIRRPINIGTQG